MTLVLLQLQSWIRSVLPDRDDDRGAAVVEYALLLAFIFAVLVLSVTVIGATTSEGLEDAGSKGFVGP
jgi:Flp pilus assembly pilin Flp